MNPYHTPDDAQKVSDIAESMERDGWIGAPLVADGEQLLTGAHRYHAAYRVLDWTDAQIPVIDVREIFEAHGLSYDALLEDEDGDVVYTITHYLPQSARDEYGIDIA